MNPEIKIRHAEVSDAQALLNIYAPYVKSTAITFEWVVPSLEDFAGRIKTISEKYPYFVAELNGTPVGYAYANTFRGRKAYSWTAELSVYVDEKYHGQGIGRALVTMVEEHLKEQGVLNLYAVIASCREDDEYLTDASVKFHSRMGYVEPAVFEKCGFKFNRWYDTTTMVKFLGEHTASPKDVIFKEKKIPSLDSVQKKYRALTKLLITKDLSITAMESCTAGFIASLITDTEGSSAVMKGSFITYSNEAKIACGVSPLIIEKKGVYSIETAEEMVRAALEKYPSHIGIGITGSFGNVDPANSDSVPGEVYIAVSVKGKTVSEKIVLPENISRFESKICAADKVVELISSTL